MSGHSHEMLTQFSHFSLYVPLAVLFASLVASPHCIAMCGPLAVSFAGDRKRFFAYHTGRVISYTGIGALSGAFGSQIFKPSQMPWLSGLTVVFIASTLILMGLRAWNGKPLHLKLPASIERFSQSLWRRLPGSRLPSSVIGGLAGFLTVFLPCGHLYSFVVGSIATGSALKGALFMSAFWLGTVPALGFGASWLKKYGMRANSRVKWAGAMLIIAGLFTLLIFSKNLIASSAHAAESHDPIKEAAAAKSLRCH